MIYGNRIRAVREALGLKQGEFARRLGISQSDLSEVEAGRKRTNGEMIVRLVTEFNVDLRWLSDGTGSLFMDGEDDENRYHIGNFGAGKAAEPERHYFVFPRAYIDEVLKVSKEALLYHIIDNDSMEPTLKKGDLVLLDVTVKEPAEEGLYLFEVGGKSIVRRYLVAPSPCLAADNPSMKKRAIPFDRKKIKCKGRIIWYGRAI